MTFARLITILLAHHGAPEPPETTDALELLYLEVVAYLVDDDRRQKTFRELKRRIGTSPEAILRASDKELEDAILAGGMDPPMRAAKLRKTALLARNIDFAALLRGKSKGETGATSETAKKTLMRFPGIGEPSADKILLFTRTEASLAPESNGLRVLARFGLIDPNNGAPSYAKTYRAASKLGARGERASERKSERASERKSERDKEDSRKKAADPGGFDFLITARELLRRHGQTLCKRAAPACESCPLKKPCAFAGESETLAK